MRILKIIGIVIFGLTTLGSLANIHSVGDFIFTLIFAGITFLLIKSYLKSKDKRKSSKVFKSAKPKVVSSKSPSYYQKVYTSGISQVRKIYDLEKMPEEFVMLDIETTGLDENYDRILEIGIVHYKNGKKLDSYNQLINPDTFIPDEITRINGITNEMVIDKPRIYEVIDEVYNRIKGKIVAGYNVEFDLKFLGVALERSNKKIDVVEAFDVLDLVKQTVGYKETPNRKLDTIKKYFGIESTGHRALSDCESTFEVMKKCLKIKENYEL
jgi:DNA polymerase III epsilon subunit family exonuclease